MQKWEIGRFVPANRSVRKSHPVPKKEGHVGRRIGILPFIAIVSALLLVTAGLETNPGPAVKVSAYLDPSPIDLEYVSVRGHCSAGTGQGTDSSSGV